MILLLYGKTTLNDGFYGFRKLYLIISIGLLVLCIINFVLIEIKYDIIKIYLINAFVLGFIMTMIIPIYAVPDEPVHLATAYNLSNKIMNQKVDNSNVYMRSCDSELDVVTVAINEEYMDNYLSYFSESVGDTTMVKTSMAPLEIPAFQYFVPAIGITIGRLFNFNAICTLMLGRLFNYLFFVFLICLSIKYIPIAKELVFGISIIPMVLQQAFSYSYDSLIIACSILSVALALNLKRTHIKRVKHIVILFILITVMSIVKGHAYIAFLFLFLIAFELEIKQMLKKIITILRKYRMVKIILSIIFLLCIIIICCLILKKTILIKESSIYTKLSYMDEDGYTLAYALNYPLDTLIFYVKTFFVQGDFYLFSTFGSQLGWLNLKVSYFTIIPIILFNFVLSFNEENEEPFLNKLDKVILFSIFILSVLFVLTGMFLSWTPVTYSAIEGVQGRYFIPVLLIVYLLINSIRGIKVSEGFKRNTIKYVSLIYTLYIVDLITLY